MGRERRKKSGNWQKQKEDKTVRKPGKGREKLIGLSVCATESRA
jgi:hypothetical protein